MLTPSIELILIVLLIAVVAYYLITKFVEDAGLRTACLLIVGVVLLLKLLAVF